MSELYAFVERELCPSCRGEGTSLYRCAFDQPPIAPFIRGYYKVDPALLSEGTYELMRCSACTLVWQRWIGDDRLLGELYGVWINDANLPEDDPLYRADIANVPLSRDAHELMAASAFLKVPLGQMTTLDYGMGWALWARIAAALGCRSYGSDLSPSRMAFAAQHGVKPLLEREIGGGERFHFINTEQVFEHVPDPLGLAQRLAEALLPGGILKISVPSGENGPAIAEALRSGRSRGSYEELMPVQPLEHVNSFTNRSIAALSARVGLGLVRPDLLSAYAFLRHRGTLDLLKPRKAAKELARPVYQFRNSSNLYRWLRKAG